MKPIKRVYVAGSYSADNVIDVLANMRRGIRTSVAVLKAGFEPFCPWLDYHFQLQVDDDDDLTVEDFYEYSMAWLEVSDALLVLPNSENSVGTQNEIKRAKELGIPIFYHLDELRKYGPENLPSDSD